MSEVFAFELREFAGRHIVVGWPAAGGSGPPVPNAGEAMNSKCILRFPPCRRTTSLPAHAQTFDGVDRPRRATVRAAVRCRVIGISCLRSSVCRRTRRRVRARTGGKKPNGELRVFCHHAGEEDAFSWRFLQDGFCNGTNSSVLPVTGQVEKKMLDSIIDIGVRLSDPA